MTMKSRAETDPHSSTAFSRLVLQEPPQNEAVEDCVTVGIPLAKGAWNGLDELALSQQNESFPLQACALDTWPDGSVRWVLLDFCVPREVTRGGALEVHRRGAAGGGQVGAAGGGAAREEASETAGAAAGDTLPRHGQRDRPTRREVRCAKGEAGNVRVDSGAACFTFAPGESFPFASVRKSGVPGQNGVRSTASASSPESACTALPEAATSTDASAALLEAVSSQLYVEDAEGRLLHAVVHEVELEETGLQRACVRLTGSFVGAESPTQSLTWICRVHIYAGRTSVRLFLTVRNPKRAEHPGGHWELGDAGSLCFRDLSLALRAPRGGKCTYRSERTLPLQTREAATVEVYQDSSGGPCWESRNHLTRDRTLSVKFSGYREVAGGSERRGTRATPWVAVHDGKSGIAADVRYFWQEFPKAIEATNDQLTLRLFPRHSATLHELQGGEQKTHEFTLSFGGEALSPERGMPAEPVSWGVPPQEIERSCALPFFVAREKSTSPLYESLVSLALEGADTFESKRERVDEYGWRHFGELWADHEAHYHKGEGAFVSHYNNQYDVVFGGFLQYARSGDPRWRRIHEELARHVIDIDIYHTTEDKPAYNQGLYWHTVHYVDGDLSTHRSYPRKGSAGGGPDDEHNYTTGLLHRYFSTGDRLARETMLASAQWVLDADDGSKTVFRWLDRGATGLATKTREFNYHGPGRGAGNSLNALIDAYRLTREAKYLAKAHEIVRRTVHPANDFAKLKLLDAENRWSYTVFLQALGKYLECLVEFDRVGAEYAYARAALLAYARWMAAHEHPILDKPDELEYPNETWAAQDVRKSDVFLFAALHSEGEERVRFVERSRSFLERSLESLATFPTKSYVRPVILLMHYGPMAFWWNATGGAERPHGPAVTDFGRQAAFVPQKTRAIAKAKKIVVGGGAAVLVLAAYVLARVLL